MTKNIYALHRSICDQEWMATFEKIATETENGDVVDMLEAMKTIGDALDKHNALSSKWFTCVDKDLESFCYMRTKDVIAELAKMAAHELSVHGFGLREFGRRPQKEEEEEEH